MGCPIVRLGFRVMAFTTPKKGKSLLEAGWAEVSGTKPCRAKKGVDVEAQVRRSLLDNFRSFTAKETDGTLVEGLTLRQRLRKDKETKLQKGSADVPFGRRYYEALRDMYAGKDRVEKLLAPQEGLKVRENLVEAATAALKHPPNRSLMVAFLSSTQTLNQAEVCGVFRWLLKLNPSASAEQLECCKAVLRAVARLKLQAALPHECGLVRSKFDEVLLQA